MYYISLRDHYDFRCKDTNYKGLAKYYFNTDELKITQKCTIIKREFKIKFKL